VLLREGATGQPEVVLIDWADCGVAPLGAELNALVGTSSLVFGWPPAQARELDQIVFASYLDGLAASGWAGDARQVRLGYVGWCALYYGRIFPGFFRFWCMPDNRSFALQQSAWRKRSCTCSGFHSWTMSWSAPMRRTNSLPLPRYYRGSLGVAVREPIWSTSRHTRDESGDSPPGQGPGVGTPPDVPSSHR
jgi:hypothetical protein